MPTITFSNKRNYYVIYFNGLVHLMIRKADFIGIQSWRESSSKEERERGFGDIKFTIEYYLKTTKVTCEYDKIEKWQTVLNLLNKHIA